MNQKTGGHWFLAAALVAGLLAAVLTVRAIAERERQVQVYVAIQEIQAFTPLAADLFRSTLVPARLAPADAVSDLQAVEGRFARTLILQDTLLRSGHLATTSTPGAVTARLTETGTEGERAFALAVDQESGVGGTVQAGDRVDVIAAIRVDSDARSLPVAKVIGRAVPVLYVESPSGMGGDGAIVLQVSPELAEEIAFARMAGEVYLATNPFDTDPQAAMTEGMTPERFLDKYGMRPGGVDGG